MYDRIQKTVNRYQLDRRAAAILLASQHQVNTARFSTAEDRAAVREVLHGTGGARAAHAETQPASAPVPRVARTRGRSTSQRPDTSVWVVHGRNLKAANELRKLLRAFGLNPLEFNQAIAKTRQGSPYVGSVLEKGIGGTGAVVVLFTPDDEARLRKEHRTPRDSAQEQGLTPQPRLNVVFEAGMAFGHDPTTPTVSVYAGGGYYYPNDDVARLSDEVRRLSDLGYRRAKIKIGSAPLARDLKRIDAATRLLDGPEHLAVDEIYSYTPMSSRSSLWSRSRATASSRADSRRSARGTLKPAAPHCRILSTWR